MNTSTNPLSTSIDSPSAQGGDSGTSLQAVAAEHIALEMEICRIAQSVRDRACDSINAQLRVEIEKVIEWASCEDTLLLIEAFRHWYEFNGEDRIQSGYLLASILYKCGIRPTAFTAPQAGGAAA